MTEKKDGYIPPQEKEPAHKEWWELNREKEVGFVGDLNGSVKAFLKNLLDLGYISIKKKGTGEEIKKEDIEKVDENNLSKINALRNSNTVEWTGGDKPVVLLGDILGDRVGNGDLVFRLIASLEKQGANITVLAGNHDIGAIHALMSGRPSANRLHAIAEQAPLTEYQGYEEWNTELYEKEMYQNPEMVEHIQQIKKMKVAEVIDDTLFVHADVDPDEFIALYQESNPDNTLSFREVVKKMNTIFQDALEQGFPEIDGQSGDKIIDRSDIHTKKSHFDTLCREKNLLSVLCGWPANRFLNKKRVDPISGAKITEMNLYPNLFFKFLKERGINALIFGHDATFTTFTEENTFIIPADGHTERTNEPDDYSYSNGKIKTDGHIDLFVGKTSQTNVRSR